MANDSILNTGMSSAVERKQRQRAKQQKQQRDAKRAALTPDAAIILSWIDQEKKDVVDLSKIVLNIDNEDNVRAQLLARQLHLTFLTNLKAKAQNILRDRTKPGEDDAA